MILVKEYTNRFLEHNREPKIEPHIFSQLIFDKGEKAIQWTEIIFSTNGAGTWTSTCKKKAKKNLDTEFILLMKITQNAL